MYFDNYRIIEISELLSKSNDMDNLFSLDMESKYFDDFHPSNSKKQNKSNFNK